MDFNLRNNLQAWEADRWRLYTFESCCGHSRVSSC